MALPQRWTRQPAGPAYPDGMTAAHHHEADDPRDVAEAVDAAARTGEVVPLFRGGRPVAAVVPAAVADAEAERRRVAAEVVAEFVAEAGAPTLAHYRQVYEGLGRPYPGDDVIRARYAVADQAS